MSVKPQSGILRLIGVLAVLAIGLYVWFLYDDFQSSTENRITQSQHMQHSADDIALYRKMLSIQKTVDAVCLADGPQVKGLSPADTAYTYAQQDYEICFEHVFFKHSFQLPFYNDPRHEFNFTKRTLAYREKMAAYRIQYEKIEEAQSLLSGQNRSTDLQKSLSTASDTDPKEQVLSDLEIYIIMQDMQRKMQASCKFEKEFTPGGSPRAKMSPEAEKIWDERCWESAIYYHSSMLPFSWWKGLEQIDVKPHFFSAKLTAYQARFPEIGD